MERAPESIGDVDRGTSEDPGVEEYRRLGIRHTLDNMTNALKSAEAGLAWTNRVPDVPDHLRPAIKEIVSKLRVVNDELARLERNPNGN